MCTCRCVHMYVLHVWIQIKLLALVTTCTLQIATAICIPKCTDARHGIKETTSNSRLSSWLGIGAEGEPAEVDPVTLAKARVAALSR